MKFVAIDFETADRDPDSACAVALVRVEGSRIIERACRLIRPPRRSFEFSWLHGISWADVEAAPTFGNVWHDLMPLMEGAELLAAHNAPFDRNVLHACCKRAGLAPPEIEFICTVQVARQTWGIYPTKLPDVCRHLRIPLKHHDPASDAEACARILMRARAQAGATAGRGRQDL